MELPRSGHFFGAKSPKKRSILQPNMRASCAHLLVAATGRLGVVSLDAHDPRVAALRQPWAGAQNACGVRGDLPMRPGKSRLALSLERSGIILRIHARAAGATSDVRGFGRRTLGLPSWIQNAKATPPPFGDSRIEVAPSRGLFSYGFTGLGVLRRRLGAERAQAAQWPDVYSVFPHSRVARSWSFKFWISSSVFVCFPNRAFRITQSKTPSGRYLQ